MSGRHFLEDTMIGNGFGCVPVVEVPICDCKGNLTA